MPEPADQTVPVSGSAPVTSQPTNNTPAGAGVADDATQKQNPLPTTPVTESREEKLRLAKIAMEGFERTVKREAYEKEEEAGEEKQKINKILSSIGHEKELLELTWVNLDDKRTSLKKVLEPVLAQEDAAQNEELQLESKEDINVIPAERHALEEQRWQIQAKRRKIEEEKWLIEEKIAKIEAQIEEIKKKYQTLLAQEEENRQKIQAIDEQIILQQEVLRQQHDLEEQKKKQEVLRQIEAEKNKAEAERQRIEEIKKAEEVRAQTSAKSIEPTTATAESISQRIEQLRKIEEEKQRQETNLRAGESEEKQTTSAPVPTPPKPAGELLAEKQASLSRALELERVRRENEEADLMKQQQAEAKTQKAVSNFTEETGGLKPLRTLKSDLDEAVKNQQVSSDDLSHASKKTFPWLSGN